MTFVAIDFETANRYSNSACALGLVRVEDDAIVEKAAYYIRPPYRTFEFTNIHGITWDDVSDATNFRELWAEIHPVFRGADFLVAHNAPFDRRVMKSCFEYYGIPDPEFEFKCTVRLSRTILGIKPANLPNVCRELGIGLRHHDAGSDSEACARIMMEILRKENAV